MTAVPWTLERAGATARDLLEITKPRLSMLVLASAAVGMALAPAPAPEWARVFATLLATAAVVGGANALNCWRERESDAWMRRTRERPLPAGRLDPLHALVAGLLLCAAGISMLTALEPLAGALAAIAAGSYVLLYTPLKPVTSLSTLVGAIPGAIPPLIGWVSASGRLDPGAWVLFIWMFLWQPPHFLALAILYREDYRNAGMPMLPVVHEEGGIVERQMVLYTAALLPMPLLLVPLSRAGLLTAVLTPLLGLAFLAVALRALRSGATERWARSAFLASIAYLGLCLLVFALDAGTSR
jgi:protoheme IX farnesyltransferase